MRYVGNVSFEVPPDHVWAALVDPEQMSQCMPGLVNWREVEPNRLFQLRVSWAAETGNPMEFPVQIEWVEATAVTFLQLRARATVGTTYHIVADGDVTLTPAEHGTDLAFSAQVTTPNPMMDRLVHTAVPKITAAFFKCLKASLTAPPPP